MGVRMLLAAAKMLGRSGRRMVLVAPRADALDRSLSKTIIVFDAGLCYVSCKLKTGRST